MLFNKKNTEIQRLRKYLNSNMSLLTITRFKKFKKMPFLNYLQMSIDYKNCVYGIFIKINEIEDGSKHLVISSTPLLITKDFWDKGYKDLIYSINNEIYFKKGEFNINIPMESYNIVADLREANKTLLPVRSRVDSGYGLQYYIETTYDDLDNVLDTIIINIIHLLETSIKYTKIIENNYMALISNI